MIEKKVDLRNFTISGPVRNGHFGGGNGRESYGVTDRYLLHDGKPWFPVMGEFHFSRYPAQYWDESLKKMKAGGIDIVSTYVFWIHHEEEKGRYDWNGDRNLREFIKLCGENNLSVFLRVGPWAHGECRNGGFPDWLVHSGIRLRENNEPYFSLVRDYYTEIFKQVKGYLFYDGGPIIGVQIENEFGHCGGLRGEAGKAHIRTLKKMAVEIGFRVPFYTTTGWGNGVVVDGETLPVLGGYAEAPWDQNTKERRAAPEYLFKGIGNETSIGTDLAQSVSTEFSYDVKKYPYLTAELGGGLETTHHRRPIVSADDTGAMACAFLGSGANLLGYYMYHGGTNPVGKFSTLQESKVTGYANDVPELSYDFQAPIGEYGKLNGSYGRLKALHLFLHDFGEAMAQTVCFLPEDNPTDAEDMTNLRYSVRLGDRGGFLFLNNYQRRRRMSDKPDVNVEIQTRRGKYKFENINLPDGDYIFYPFELALGSFRLFTADAQLLMKVKNREKTAFIFFCDEDECPTYRFYADGISGVDSKTNRLTGNGRILEIVLEPSEFYKAITLTSDSGDSVELVTIKRQDAYKAWKISEGGNEYLAVADAGIVQERQGISFESRRETERLLLYPKVSPSRIEVCSGAAMREEPCVNDFSNDIIRFDPPACFPSVQVGNELKREDGISYQLEIKCPVSANSSDHILKIRFEGDKARLTIDGKVSADRFFYGPDWEIGLKRFGCLDSKDVRLDIRKLGKDDRVFLEKKPEYVDGIACKLNDIEIFPEYRCEMKFKP